MAVAVVEVVPAAAPAQVAAAALWYGAARDSAAVAEWSRAGGHKSEIEAQEERGS